jgi:hypothetical protein
MNIILQILIMNTIIDELLSLKDEAQSKNLSRFFKTSKGQY